jgi:hypothetical protein
VVLVNGVPEEVPTEVREKWWSKYGPPVVKTRPEVLVSRVDKE